MNCLNDKIQTYRRCSLMGNNITDRLKYKESVVKLSKKCGVAKAAYKFGERKRTIYRWRKRYDGTLESLKDKSRRP